MTDKKFLFIDKFKMLFQDNIVSFYEYYDFSDKLLPANKQKINLMLILQKISPKDYENLKKVDINLIKKAYKSLGVQIKIFSFEEFHNSLDVFPIEFLSLKQNRVLLLGKDIIDDVKISNANLRHECEFYLRTYNLKLREAYFIQKIKPADLIQESLPFLLTIFNFLLFLLKIDQPNTSLRIIELLSEKFEFDRQIFISILNNFGTKKSGEYMKEYLQALSIIIKKVDKLSIV